MAIVTAGFVVFSLAARYLPLFEHEAAKQPGTLPAQEAWAEDLNLVSQPYVAERVTQ